MPLRVSTTGSNVQLDDLGITVTHPTTNRDLTLEFTAQELKESEDLTAAVQASSLTVDDGQFQINATDYDANEVFNQDLGLKTDSRFVSHDELTAGKQDTPVHSGVFPIAVNSCANATSNVYIPTARWGTWEIDEDDVVVISGSTAADGVYTVDSVTDHQNFTVKESIPDSTGGTATIYHPAASKRIGVDPTNISNSSASLLQDVLEDLDGAITGGGLTPESHRTLDQLVHWLDEDYYQEYTYWGSRVTNITIWTDSGKTTKIREFQYSYSSGKVSQEVIIQYNGSGVEVERLTLTYTYSGSRVSNITTVRT